MLLVGGSVAAVSATGQGSSHPRAHRQHGAHPARGRLIAAAAAYLGISVEQLSGELRSGKSLAEVADAIPGKSAAGLTQTLVAARKARLDTTAARLPSRVAAEVNRPGGPGGAAGAGGFRAMRLKAIFSRPKSVGSLAARYLGVEPAQLKAQLRSGRTLAQVADATAGKSKAGLVDALVAARQSRLEQAVAAGRITRSSQAKRLARLHKRVNALVERQFAGASRPG